MKIAEITRKFFYNEKYGRILRYIVVGGINTLVTFIIYTICVGVFHTHFTIGQIFGYIGGVLNSFVLNKIWTFGVKYSKKTRQEFIQFVIVNIISLGASLLILKVFIDYFLIDKYIAQLPATAVTLVVNYFGYKIWVFKRSEAAGNNVDGV